VVKVPLEDRLVIEDPADHDYRIIALDGLASHLGLIPIVAPFCMLQSTGYPSIPA
jgi:hypothetical protein